MSLSPRIATVFGLTVALAGLGMTQTKAPQGPAKKPAKKAAAQSHPEVAVWKPAKMSGMDVAKRVDLALAGMKRVECESSMLVTMPKRGGSGGMNLVSSIQDAKTYSLKIPVLSMVKREELHTIRIRANGKKSEWMEQRLKKPIVQPVSKVKLAANAKPEDWVLGHPRFIYGSVLGETPFSTLIRNASKPGSGMVVKVNERVKRRLNVAYHQYQLIVTRTPAAEKRLGELRIETIVDAKQWLPVNIGAKAIAKGAEPVMVVNHLRWKFRRTPFNPKTFAFPGA